MSDFRPCRECKDWGKCLLTEREREYFGYHHIRYCPVQVFFLLKYDEILRGRAWPVPDDTAPGGMGMRVLSEADFAKVSLVLAELDQRIERTRLKGEVLREQCKNRERVEHLSDNAKDALYYVCGDNRKRDSFTSWLAKKRYREDKLYRSRNYAQS